MLSPSPETLFLPAHGKAQAETTGWGCWNPGKAVVVAAAPGTRSFHGLMCPSRNGSFLNTIFQSLWATVYLRTKTLKLALGSDVAWAILIQNPATGKLCDLGQIT